MGRTAEVLSHQQKAAPHRSKLAARTPPFILSWVYLFSLYRYPSNSFDILLLLYFFADSRKVKLKSS